MIHKKPQIAGCVSKSVSLTQKKAMNPYKQRAHGL